MSSIILPEEEQEEKLEYTPTEDDEKNFFLIYHLHIQPSELNSMTPVFKEYLIQRFMMQKQAEREMMEQQRLMHSLGGNFKG